jgi:drug/metabolite transporter (DMT)-like permease
MWNDMARANPRYSAKLTVSLSAVYLIWGSTFLFTKLAVTHLPIALYSAARFLTAGSVLALAARLWKGDEWPGRPIEWGHVLVTGFCMVFVSNGMNAWALQFIPTNQSALLNGTSAFWITGLGVLGPRGHPLTRRVALGLLIGFAGTVLMLIPDSGWERRSVLAESGVLGACLAFSLGTLYYRSIDTELSPLMFMGLQLFCGGLMLLTVAVFRGDEARWTFDTTGLIALAYLTFVSSCVAFTAYGWLTRNATPAVIASYSYVNPAIAACLGWWILHERLSHVQLTGMVIIIVGVSLLTFSREGLADPETLGEPKTP